MVFMAHNSGHDDPVILSSIQYLLRDDSSWQRASATSIRDVFSSDNSVQLPINALRPRAARISQGQAQFIFSPKAIMTWLVIEAFTTRCGLITRYITQL